MERIRICGQARRSQPASAVYRAISAADRLANLVCGNGNTVGLSVDTAFCLETFAQRPRYGVAPGERSVSRQSAALRSRAIVSLSVCAAGRARLVAARTSRGMATALLGRPQPPARSYLAAAVDG